MRWYERLAQIDSEKERQAFVQGVFFPGAQQKYPFTVGLIAGFMGVKALESKAGQRDTKR